MFSINRVRHVTTVSRRTYHAGIGLDTLQADPAGTHQLALNDEVLEGRDVAQDMAESVALEVSRQLLSVVRINYFEHFNVLLARNVFNFKSVVLGHLSAFVIEAAVVVSDSLEFFLDLFDLDGNRIAFSVNCTRVLFGHDIDCTCNTLNGHSAAEELLVLGVVYYYE